MGTEMTGLLVKLASMIVLYIYTIKIMNFLTISSWAKDC